MGLARSTFYDCPERPADDTTIVEAMFAVCDDFESYGYRRVTRTPAPCFPTTRVRTTRPAALSMSLGANPTTSW